MVRWALFAINAFEAGEGKESRDGSSRCNRSEKYDEGSADVDGLYDCGFLDDAVSLFEVCRAIFRFADMDRVFRVRCSRREQSFF